jgi:ABC-type glycerol-3-phosphate transport system substrate-binding protein
VSHAEISGRVAKLRYDLTAKFAPWIFAAVVVFLSACGTQPTSTITPEDKTPATPRISTQTTTPVPATSTAVPTSALGIEAEDLEGITLSLWHPWSGELGQALQSSIDSFNAENPYGISAQAIYQGDYNDLYSAIDAAETGTLPNLVVAYAYQIRKWAAEGRPAADLEPYVNDPEWGLTGDEQDDFQPEIFEADTAGGARYGFPIQRNGEAIYYNASWAQELGFDSPPETADEFKEQACAAAQANSSDQEPGNDGTGGWVVNTTPTAILSWMYAFDSDVVAADGDGYRFDTPETEEMIAFLNDLLDSGCAWESTGPFNGVEFATRQAIFASAPLADYPIQIAEFERAGNDDEWMAIPYPAPEGEPVMTVYGPALAAFADSREETLASWLLIKWLAEPEQQARLVEAGDSLPLRESSLDHLEDYAGTNPHWSQGVELLEYARAEPNLPSWGVVRWVVGDVGTQIFRYYFTLDRTRATLELMDETAAELHARFKEGG